MIREVNLIQYLPTYMQEYKEPVEALRAENPEFTLEWEATDKVFKNRFISTADEDGIMHYERMLNIHPTANDTLESRRTRVQTKWFNKIPYTYRAFLTRLALLCGDHDFTIERNFETGYYLYLQVNLTKPGQVDDLDSIIKTMFPENIIVDVDNRLYFMGDGNMKTAGCMALTRHYSIISERDVDYVVNGPTAVKTTVAMTKQYVLNTV